MTGPVKGQGIHANTAGIRTKRSGYLAQWMCLLPLENEEVKVELFSCLSCLVFFLFSLFFPFNLHSNKSYVWLQNRTTTW